MPGNEAFLGLEGGVQGKGPSEAAGCLPVLPSPLCASLCSGRADSPGAGALRIRSSLSLSFLINKMGVVPEGALQVSVKSQTDKQGWESLKQEDAALSPSLSPHFPPPLSLSLPQLWFKSQFCHFRAVLASGVFLNISEPTFLFYKIGMLKNAWYRPYKALASGLAGRNVPEGEFLPSSLLWPRSEGCIVS